MVFRYGYFTKFRKYLPIDRPLSSGRVADIVFISDFVFCFPYSTKVPRNNHDNTFPQLGFMMKKNWGGAIVKIQGQKSSKSKETKAFLRIVSSFQSSWRNTNLRRRDLVFFSMTDRQNGEMDRTYGAQEGPFLQHSYKFVATKVSIFCSWSLPVSESRICFTFV